MHICAITQSANRMAAMRCISSCRYSSGASANVHMRLRISAGAHRWLGQVHEPNLPCVNSLVQRCVRYFSVYHLIKAASNEMMLHVTMKKLLFEHDGEFRENHRIQVWRLLCLQHKSRAKGVPPRFNIVLLLKCLHIILNLFKLPKFHLLHEAAHCLQRCLRFPPPSLQFCQIFLQGHFLSGLKVNEVRFCLEWECLIIFSVSFNLKSIYSLSLEL